MAPTKARSSLSVVMKGGLTCRVLPRSGREMKPRSRSSSQICSACRSSLREMPPRMPRAELLELGAQQRLQLADAREQVLLLQEVEVAHRHCARGGMPGVGGAMPEDRRG